MQLAKHESEGDHLGAVERNARAVVQLLTFRFAGLVCCADARIRGCSCQK